MMKTIIEIEWFPRDSWFAVWICPYCNRKNRRFDDVLSKLTVKQMLRKLLERMQQLESGGEVPSGIREARDGAVPDSSVIQGLGTPKPELEQKKVKL
jgi:hypothetical protein